MLEMLHLKNVGPAPEMKLEFAPRLNVITGDNGLGKSFILDCVWFGLTQTWSQEINQNLVAGGMVIPNSHKAASVQMKHNRFEKPYQTSVFQFETRGQFWYLEPSNLKSDIGLVIQNYFNGGFAVFDSVRHINPGFSQMSDVPTPEIFIEKEVWDVNEKAEGLIRDVANWQRENGNTFKQFKSVLEYLSPSHAEKLELGELVPVRLKDAFDTPTVKMPYGTSVPITQASSGIRKIFAFAYMLVWSWRQHSRASQVIKQEPQKRITFLIDEIESHLHPKWQRVIVQSLLNVAKALSDELEVQIILTTHSPLVMQSLETVFDPEKDAWFDLDFDKTKKEVVLEKREFFKRGTLDYWITSEAFDEPTAYNPEAQAVMNEVSNALKKKLTVQKARSLNKKLLHVLSDIDPFWARWHMALEHQGIEL